MRCHHPSPPRQALRPALQKALPQLALALLATLAAPAQATLVTYQITGTLQRSYTSGANIESHVQAIGFDGGHFRATVTLDNSVADSDARSTRGLYLGALTASTLQVESTVFSHNNYCNLDPYILDCSVEALNNHIDSALNPRLQRDSWFLNSQVYSAADVPGLPPYLRFMTFDLTADSLFGTAVAPNRFENTALDFGLERLGADIPGHFGLDLRGYEPNNFSENFSVYWRSSDLQVTRLLADAGGDPAEVPEPTSAALALLALVALAAPARLRHGGISAPWVRHRKPGRRTSRTPRCLNARPHCIPIRINPRGESSMCKRVLKAALFAATALVATASQATAIQLDFEGLGSLAEIRNFYNGGTDSQGNAGTNYGISFGSNALALKESYPYANFSRAPSSETVMFFLTGTAILNYAPGFSDGFAFYYSTVNFAAKVQVYDDLNATGNLLGEISIAALGYGPDPDNPFSNWAVGSLGFAGTARSINFGGTVNQVVYDNITFGSTDPTSLPAANPTLPNEVPEPGSLALGLIALALAARARRAGRA